MTFVELQYCGLYLFLYSLNKLKLLSWISHPHNLLEDLHCAAIRSLIEYSWADVELFQCFFI